EGRLESGGDPWNSFCPLIVLKTRMISNPVHCPTMRSHAGWSIGSAMCSDGTDTLSSVQLSQNQYTWSAYALAAPYSHCSRHVRPIWAKRLTCNASSLLA